MTVLPAGKAKHSALLPVVAVMTGTRTAINTGFRMIYPLLPVFARGVNVEVGALVTVLTLMQLIGLISPFIGRISEQRGRRFTILLGLMLYALGMLAVFVLPNVLGLALALLIAAVGKTAFDPAMQAYIGDRVPYSQRGMYLGIMELAWSGAFFIGVPLMTWLIANAGWQAPFGLLAILVGIGLLAVWNLLETDFVPVERVAFFTAVRTAVNSRMAVAGLILGFSISAANQLVSVQFGSWIEQSFGIQLTALAVAAVVIGVAELCGEGIVARFADWFGKRRLVMLGVGANIIACLLLPLTGSDLNLVLVGLFVFYLTFELSVVASIPLATELSPHARGMYMTVLVTAVTIGRAVFTPVAPMLFTGGMLANCLVAVILNVVGFVMVWKFISVK